MADRFFSHNPSGHDMETEARSANSFAANSGIERPKNPSKQIFINIRAMINSI